MKSMIAMMNAMKVYKVNDLIHNREDVQEKLSADINRSAYQKLMDRIHAKHGLKRS